MTVTRSLTASLKGFGAPPTTAAVVIESLTPIPLVHFVLVPGSLLLGVILGATRLARREIFRSAEGPCPFCGTQQRLGLAGKSFRLPRRAHCTNCGRELDLEENR